MSDLQSLKKQLADLKSQLANEMINASNPAITVEQSKIQQNIDRVEQQIKNLTQNTGVYDYEKQLTGTDYNNPYNYGGSSSKTHIVLNGTNLKRKVYLDDKKKKYIKLNNKHVYLSSIRGKYRYMGI